jgi:hypothetical protein
MVGGIGCALAVRRGRAADWPTQWQVQSLRFHADFALRPETPIVQDSLDLDRSIPQILALSPRDETVYIYLFSDRRTYQSYLKQYFPRIPYRRALFIKQQGRGMVFAYYSRDFAVDLRHETSHAVLHTLLPMVPLWLDEGLAEYFEVAAPERVTGNPHLKSTLRNVRWHRPPSLELLESIHDLEQMKQEQYRDAWSWVHYMLHGPTAARREFRSYLRDIERRTPPGQLATRLQQRVPDLYRSYVDHFLRLQRPIELG